MEYGLCICILNLCISHFVLQYTFDREAKVILVGNKCDLTEQREIDQERVETVSDIVYIM